MIKLKVNGFHYESESENELIEFLLDDYPNIYYGLTEDSLFDVVRNLEKLGHVVENLNKNTIL